MNGFCESSFKYVVALNTQRESTYASGLGMKLPAGNPNDKVYKLRGVEQTGLLTNRVGVSERFNPVHVTQRSLQTLNGSQEVALQKRGSIHPLYKRGGGSDCTTHTDLPYVWTGLQLRPRVPLLNLSVISDTSAWFCEQFLPTRTALIWAWATCSSISGQLRTGWVQIWRQYRENHQQNTSNDFPHVLSLSQSITFIYLVGRSLLQILLYIYLHVTFMLKLWWYIWGLWTASYMNINRERERDGGRYELVTGNGEPQSEL